MPISPNPPRHTEAMRWRIFPAAGLIALGVLFLLNNLGYPLAFLTRGNWWALFILCAALVPLSRAFALYRARGRADTEVAYCLLSGATVALVGIMFLANLDWSVWWPLFIIVGGFYTLAPRRYRCGHHYWRRCWHDDDEAPAKQ